MRNFRRKQINILIIVLLLSIFVVLLYPVGSKILDLVRNPHVIYGKEIIYPDIDNGDIHVANGVLENKYEISRFKSVSIDEQKWKEDPFSDIYWRFNYYNLEPVRNLLFAWIKTGKPAYKNKLIEITESFIEAGVNGPYSWDYHGVAFRTMTLVNVREKLRKKNELTVDLDEKITETLKIHGDFLANSAHFEADFNHGLDQAAALYLLAVNFPSMPEADRWLKISSARIIEMQKNIIDDDGVLVENSPYYHIYVLEKFLAIDKYLKQNHLVIEGFSEEKIDKMISYVVYILQPDLTVPTIGASIERKINLFGLYKEIAELRPDLLYVLTQGKHGRKPSALNIYYPVSGETIMRSAWGKGNSYGNQTQVIFDVGNYRTNHSDLDALSFNLFGRGIDLMPDSGLYTYENGSYRSYFHGTKSHNTVVVDGKDQNIGGESKKVSSGFFKEGNGYVYQSGQHTLYDGVSHKRAIVMIEDSTVIILDNLKSDSSHIYEQIFHLFPGAKINLNSLTLTAQGDKVEQSLTIKQFITENLELKKVINEQNPPNGLCSSEYKVAVPCYSVAYVQKGNNVSYITAISIGQDTADINFNKDNNYLRVKTKKSEYNIKINETQKIERSIEVNTKTEESKINVTSEPIDSLNALSEWQQFPGKGVEIDKVPAAVNDKEKSLEIISLSDGSRFNIEKNADLDLSNQNISFKFKFDKILNLQGFDMYLSNDNWKNYARFDIKTVIPDPSQDTNRNNEWIRFKVAKGDLRKTELGNWKKNNPAFDWSKIDSVKFTVTSKEGKNAIVNIKDFNFVTDQKEARAIIVFDDGWSSVMDAAKVMNKYDTKGNVAVITGSVGEKRYLTLDNLKTLQNDYGWNIASHTSLHKNAVIEYVNDNNLSGFDNDITDALQYLIKNNINSAPNWFIFPDGSINNIVKKVISKYYKFARATVNVPASFPFAEPFEVGALTVYSDIARPIDVHNAINDAIKYKQTIFLVFHKISQGVPSVHTEYALDNFDVILKDIKNQGIKVVTLSEFDKENNIPQTEFVLHDTIPEQFDLDISENYISNRKQNAIIEKWEYFLVFLNNIIQGFNFL